MALAVAPETVKLPAIPVVPAAKVFVPPVLRVR